MRRLHTEPPPNYQATSLSQILRADREVWVHMSQNVDDIRQQPDGSRPLDRAIMEALSDYNVAFHLLPLPLPSSSSYAPVRNREASQFDTNYKGKSGSSGRKGKGKSKNQQGSSVAPRGITGAVGRDSKGRAICFNFNLGECPDAPVGGVCKRGRHVCFKATRPMHLVWRMLARCQRMLAIQTDLGPPRRFHRAGCNHLRALFRYSRRDCSL